MPPEANELEINGQESVETEQADKEQLEMPLSRAGPSSVGAKKKASGKRKHEDSNEPLEKLLASCTNIGQNFETFLNQNLLQNEDYHFALSIVQSLRQIPNKKKKLLLKAKILTQIAEASDVD